MNEENQVYFVDSDKLPEEALKRKHRLEQDPTFRTNHMEYMEGMEVIQSDIKDKVEEAMKAFDYDAYTAGDVGGRCPMKHVPLKILRHFYPLQRLLIWR